MDRRRKHIVQLLLVSIILLVTALPGLAAEVSRVPGQEIVEQGVLSLTLDVEGAEDFRYSGLEDKWHTYRGKIKAGDNLKFDIRVKLADKKTLPITGRSCTMRSEVIAKKDGQVIEKKNFKADNKINVFFKYSVPEGTDTLEVSEVFVLSNKSKEEKFNQKSTTQNKLILTAKDVQPAVGATKENDKVKEHDKVSEKEDKKDNSKETGKTGEGDKGDSSRKDSKGTGKENGKKSTLQKIAGAAAVLLVAGVGGYFFMKRKKEEQAANEEIARKEKLRQQAIRKQQELQQQVGAQAIQRQQESQQQNIPAQEQHTMAQQAGVAGSVATMDNAVAAQQKPCFCTSCGAPLKPGTRFCENCGAKV
jgi:hypothetical protein